MARPFTTSLTARKVRVPETTLPKGDDIAPALALSDERDAWHAHALAMRRGGYRDGYRAGSAASYAAGWAAAEDAAERAHQAAARRVFEADPGSPEARASVNRRAQAAASGCRRDALEHWRQRWAELHRLSHDERYVREALAIDPPWKRSYDQVMAVVLSAARRAAA